MDEADGIRDGLLVTGRSGEVEGTRGEAGEIAVVGVVDEGEGSKPEAEAVGPCGASELKDIGDEKLSGSARDLQTAPRFFKKLCEWLGLWERPDGV